MARTRTQIIAAAKAANANAGLAPDTLRILIDTRLAAAGMPRMTAREAGELVTGSDSQPTASGPRAELSAASPAGQSRAYLLDSFRRQYRSDPAIRKVTSSERSFVNGSLIAASQPALTDDEARSLCLVG